MTACLLLSKQNRYLEEQRGVCATKARSEKLEIYTGVAFFLPLFSHTWRFHFLLSCQKHGKASAAISIFEANTFYTHCHNIFAGRKSVLQGTLRQVALYNIQYRKLLRINLLHNRFTFPAANLSMTYKSPLICCYKTFMSQRKVNKVTLQKHYKTMNWIDLWSLLPLSVSHTWYLSQKPSRSDGIFFCCKLSH